MKKTLRYHISKNTVNSKLGKIKVTTSSKSTCPSSCPLKNNGCYANNFPMSVHWENVDNTYGTEFKEHIKEIKTLPPDTKVRINQAGDLPGYGDKINVRQLKQLDRALKNKISYTYTHKLSRNIKFKYFISNYRTIKALKNLVVNISCDTVFDLLWSKINMPKLPRTLTLDYIPDAEIKSLRIAGERILICPAQRVKHISCETCMLCAHKDRTYTIGFIPHGNKKSDIIKRNMEFISDTDLSPLDRCIASLHRNGYAMDQLLSNGNWQFRKGDSIAYLNFRNDTPYVNYVG